ncbi:MAG: hypothetical protein LBC85_12295 [Fibromonadaceae bacterium]|jgi:hypothetical protein|nr:hypothetical protein [Fibromonadaceae bacterium]
MSKSKLHQLFDGEIFPSENINPSDPKYAEVKKALDEEINYFIGTLSDGDAERFQKINDLYYKAAAMYDYECFAHGFRLAVTLMVESMRLFREKIREKIRQDMSIQKKMPSHCST